MENKTKKRCIICGCTEHFIFGCVTHWKYHKKNNGKCNNDSTM